MNHSLSTYIDFIQSIGSLSIFIIIIISIKMIIKQTNKEIIKSKIRIEK